VADGGHFGLLPPTTSAHTFERDTLSNFLFLTFKEDKKTEKRTFAIHGHGSAEDDPTISAILNVMRWSTGNQWSVSQSVGVTWTVMAA